MRMVRAIPQSFGPRGTLLLACLIFFCNGMLLSTIGPALPSLAANAATSLAALGGVFTTLFLGALLAQLGAGQLQARLGQARQLQAGLLCLALGALLLTQSRAWWLTFLGTGLIGMGFGLSNLGVSVLIAELFAARRAAALNLLNVFFGIGAISGPALASLALRLWASALPPLGLAAGLLAVLLPLITRLRPAAGPGAPATAGRAGVYRAALPWLLGGVLFCYIGAEHGMGGWTAAYLLRTTALDAAAAALAVSGFWLALTCGRGIAAALGLWLAPTALLLGSIAGALASAGLLIATTGNTALSLLAIALLGLCLGPIFPTTVAIVTAAFPQAPAAAAGVAVGMSSLGGVILPWLQGLLLERGGATLSVLVVAGNSLIMLALGGMALFLLAVGQAKGGSHGSERRAASAGQGRAAAAQPAARG